MVQWSGVTGGGGPSGVAHCETVQLSVGVYDPCKEIGVSLLLQYMLDSAAHIQQNVLIG